MVDTRDELERVMVMSLRRSLEPEWLDALPADDPGAIHARRDLRMLNGIMLQSRIMSRLLARYGTARKPRRILDLGAGDGTFMLRVAKNLSTRWPGVAITLVDRQCLLDRKTREGFQSVGWSVEAVTAEVSDFIDGHETGIVDIVTANLFLHHLSQKQLAHTCRRVAQIAPLFCACEPRRNAFALFSSRLVWALGCNRVTRHDAPASVRAGFNRRELSALWPKDRPWHVHEHGAWPFTHCFVARYGN